MAITDLIFDQNFLALALAVEVGIMVFFTFKYVKQHTGYKDESLAIFRSLDEKIYLMLLSLERTRKEGTSKSLPQYMQSLPVRVHDEEEKEDALIEITEVV